MGRISCNQSMSKDTLGFTCGIYGPLAQGDLNSKGLTLRDSMTCFKVSLSILMRDQFVP